jgi:hypothetical protein
MNNFQYEFNKKMVNADLDAKKGVSEIPEAIKYLADRIYESNTLVADKGVTNYFNININIDPNCNDDKITTLVTKLITVVEKVNCNS